MLKFMSYGNAAMIFTNVTERMLATQLPKSESTEVEAASK